MQPIKVHRIKTISQYHLLAGLPSPEHPLISVINLNEIKHLTIENPINLIYDFYSISLKKDIDAKYKYGQQQYDFDNGQLFFMSPNQLFGIEPNIDAIKKPKGWIIFIHPDFLWNTKLANTIKQYEFFDYGVNEALYLSTKEEKTLLNIVKNIQNEYNANMDKFSQDVIIAQLELLLTYSQRFYDRQFITRKIGNHKILEQLENLLNGYFKNPTLVSNKVLTVDYISQNLNISASYLRSLLKNLTGLNTQQFIHEKIIEKAKERLSTTNLTVSQIAYELGFEHPQSFSKLFKSKTNTSPLEFRARFN